MHSKPASNRFEHRCLVNALAATLVFVVCPVVSSAQNYIGIADRKFRNQPVVDEIRRCRRNLVKSVNAHDLEAVLKFYAPTFAARDRMGKSSGYNERAQALRAAFDPSNRYAEEVEILSIDVKNDVGVRIRKKTIRFDSDGEQHVTAGRYWELWRKNGRRWQIVSEGER